MSTCYSTKWWNLFTYIRIDFTENLFHVIPLLVHINVPNCPYLSVHPKHIQLLAEELAQKHMKALMLFDVMMIPWFADPKWWVSKDLWWLTSLEWWFFIDLPGFSFDDTGTRVLGIAEFPRARACDLKRDGPFRRGWIRLRETAEFGNFWRSLAQLLKVFQVSLKNLASELSDWSKRPIAARLSGRESVKHGKTRGEDCHDA